MSAWFLLLVVWSVGLCVGFRLPHNKLSSNKTDMRQMAYNGTRVWHVANTNLN